MAEKRDETARILQRLPEELIGQSVLVRPYRPGDGMALFEAVDESREHLRPWMPWVEEHRTSDDSEAYVRRAHARWLLRDDLPVGFWERDTGRYLGGSGLHRIDWDVPSFEIGYWIRASAEGKGFVTETVWLLCTLAFETLAANRVFIRCDSRNARSAAIPRRLEFAHEATLRNETRSLSGNLRDTFSFSMTPEDYANLKARKSS